MAASPSAGTILASVALTFFAYLGFNVITFAVGDLRDPKHEMPRAMYQSLGITTVVYVLISIGVFGTLTVEDRAEHDRERGAFGLAPATP